MYLAQDEQGNEVKLPQINLSLLTHLETMTPLIPKQGGLSDMENFLSEWDQTLSNMQYGPLGIIAMQGIDELGRNINNYLLKWHELQDLQDEEYYTSPGKDREDFLIDAVCPRFGTGEAKALFGRVWI